jgi:hypothetical protein
MPMSFLRRKDTFSRTTGWRYENAGLPVLRVGGKLFCRESDFVAFLEKMDGQTLPAKTCESTANEKGKS